MTQSKVIEDTVNEDYYDQVLPKESDYMKPIRRMEKRLGFITPVLWTSAISITLFHIIVITYFGYITSIGHRCLKETIIFETIIGLMAGLGVTAGAHRLWSHRSYKARKPLKILLLLFYAIAGQNNLYNWVRDHRVHHKRSESSADPHDANRGFFFAHVGWLMMKKHPHVRAEGSKIDMSDITNDPVLVYYNRHFNWFKLFFCFLIPMTLPVLLFGESIRMSVVAAFVRYLISLNATWSVNSFAHLHGLKPYNKDIMPSENIVVSILAIGEGWHNYHHTFPWDYKAAELSYFFNGTTAFLDVAAYLGLAYDMKQASPNLIKNVSEKRGDETRKNA